MKKKWNKIVEEILKLDEDMSQLSDVELRYKTTEFKQRLKEGVTLDSLLPEAFAVVREAAFRVVNMKPYPVQIMGGIAIHEGNIAEMATGEGKTLVSTMPAYLNALEEKGVHVVTVNDYLAKRDAEWMGKIHEFLGLSVGYILNDYTPDRRKKAYNCDITYITNNELGFDYLRDNMAKKSNDIVQRGLHFAIIDEIDSILIDEARTPLIISGNERDASSLYIACNVLARQMIKGEGDGRLKKIDAILGEDIVEDGDFYVDEKDKIVSLTASGVEKVEDYFHIENFSAPEHLAIQRTIILALKANYLMFRDKDYVVKDQQVFIVDEFTGRIMQGRRFSDGLHQAIEAKENVVIQKENNTLATITLQNFFNKYDKKAGMTGTAKTEEKEFRDTYHMKVCPIPTNKPISRVDEPDSLYLTKKEKFHAIIEDIVKTHEKEQPVLVGTINIDTSEYLSNELKKIGIKHQVLNAKYHEAEAEIISHAGEKGMVTIATNMAGRGTDIILGEGVLALGGLRVIGTERHESRRIDNQLRGRSGRQGDIGSSKFYLSLEDNLIRLFGLEKYIDIYRKLGIEENEEIIHKTVSKQVEKAQKRVELNNYNMRKQLLDYDKVNNDQRELIYAERRKLLNKEDVHEAIINMLHDVADSCISYDKKRKEWDISSLATYLESDEMITVTPDSTKKDLSKTVFEEFLKKYQKIESMFIPEQMRETERNVLLEVIDNNWMLQLDNMEHLKQSISLQSYAQKDPVAQYKLEGYNMFDKMLASIRSDIAATFTHIYYQPTEA